MKDADWVMYTFNMLEAQKKNKEDVKTNKKFSEKDQEGSSKNILHEKPVQKTILGNKESNSQLPMEEGKNADNHEQQIIQGEFESRNDDRQLNNPNLTLKDNNIDNTCLYPLLHTCEELKSEKFKKYSEGNIRQDQENPFEEEFPNQQQEDIDGELELNKVMCEADRTDHCDRILNDNTGNYGSKLLKKNEKDGNYHTTQGLPKSIKFRSIDNLYKCTSRVSPIEDEYSWNCPTKENSNINYLKNEDSSIKASKMSAGCERKDKNNNEEKDDATSSP